MKFLFVFLVFTLVEMSAWSQVAASDSSIEISWLDLETQKNFNSKGAIGGIAVDGNKVVFIKTDIPLVIADSVYKKNDDGEKVLLRSKASKAATTLLLDQSEGELFYLNSGVEKKLKYKIKFSAPVLQIDSTCQSLNIVKKFEPGTDFSHPAMLSCQMNGDEIQGLVFSNLETSEWFGASLPVQSGKGQRWKVFSSKEFSNEKKWQLTWGAEKSKSSLKLYFKITKPKAETIAKKTYELQVGLEIDQLQVERKNFDSVQVLKLNLPVRGNYYLERWPIFLELAGSFSLLTLQASSDKKAHSIQRFQAGAGYYFESSRYQLLLGLGMLNQIFEFPSVNLGATVSGPGLKIDGQVKGMSYDYGVSISQFSSSSNGSFSQLVLELNSRIKKILPEKTQIFLQNQQMKLESSSYNLNTSENILGFRYEF